MTKVLDYLCELIYNNPVNVRIPGYIKRTCEKFGVTQDELHSTFVKTFEVDPIEYAKTVREEYGCIDESLTEDLGDFIGNKVAQGADKLLAKLPGQVSTAAQARMSNRQQAENWLKGWTMMSTKANLPATLANLRTYVQSLGLNQQAINQLFKDFGRYFNTNVAQQQAQAAVKQTNATAQQAQAAQSARPSVPTQPALQTASLKKWGNLITEAPIVQTLPSGAFREFFNRAVQLQQAALFKAGGQKQTVQVKANPSANTNMANNTQPVPTQQVQAAQQPNINAVLKNLSPDAKTKLIAATFKTLPQDQQAAFFNQVMGKKS